MEDYFEDVLGKTVRGLGYSVMEVALKAGVASVEVEKLLQGKYDKEAAMKVAAVLGIHGPTLDELARLAWAPEPRDIDGLALFNTKFEAFDMLVNAFLIWDPATKKAAVFDTGANASEMLQSISDRNLAVESIFITHTHSDHIADLERVKAETGNPPAFVHEKEPLPGVETFLEGRAFTIGNLQVETRLTSGHAIGGITYILRGLAQPVAVVGDAMFCCSMGGGKISFPMALKNNREQIMTLSDDTIICPGHGPMTTVGEEKAHNSFFPEFKV